MKLIVFALTRVAIEPISAITVVPRYTLYPDAAIFVEPESVDPSHERFIAVVETAVAVKLVGAEGGVVSEAGVTVGVVVTVDVVVVAVVPIVVVATETPDPEEDVVVEIVTGTAGGMYVCPRHAAAEP